MSDESAEADSFLRAKRKREPEFPDHDDYCISWERMPSSALPSNAEVLEAAVFPVSGTTVYACCVC